MYEIHELANIVAMADEKEQRALTEDIRKNGQDLPAVLWQGKIVDGRCRQLACTTLGTKLKTRTLDDDLSREEVASIVKSLNTRRNLTMTQKIMSAVKEQVRTGATNKDIAEQWAISERSLKSGKYIKKHREDLVNLLFDGKSVTLNDPDKSYDVTTNKINTVARLIKKNLEVDVVLDTAEEVALEWSVDGILKTEKAKDWYYKEAAPVLNQLPATSLKPWLMAKLVELANYKAKEGDV